jgi:hypothetical protein
VRDRSEGDARDRYSIRYYLIAMLFVIFDIETIFMFPWAVTLDTLAWFGLIEMLVFIFILVVGLSLCVAEGCAGVADVIREPRPTDDPVSCVGMDVKRRVPAARAEAAVRNLQPPSSKIPFLLPY